MFHILYIIIHLSISTSKLVGTLSVKPRLSIRNFITYTLLLLYLKLDIFKHNKIKMNFIIYQTKSNSDRRLRGTIT